jgi:recombination protein RecA
MSSVVISTSAAGSRPFLFDTDSEPGVSLLPEAKKPSKTESKIAQIVQSTTKNQQSPVATAMGNGKPEIENSLLPASQLAVRPAPEMVSSGIPVLDTLTGGWPRGCLTEICGPASSGRTTVLLAALAAAIGRDEFCVVVDASDALDPRSLAAAGADLDHLLWVRCGKDFPHPSNSPHGHGSTEKQPNQKESGRLISRAQFTREVEISPPAKLNFDFGKSRTPEHRLAQALRVTDLLLESGGFGLIVLDLADLPVQAARRIPLATWFRFRRAIEYQPTILLAIEQQPIAGSCSSLLLQLGAPRAQYTLPGSKSFHHPGPKPAHAQLLDEVEIHAQLIRSRLERKPAGSVTFASKTAWAG